MNWAKYIPSVEIWGDKAVIGEGLEEAAESSNSLRGREGRWWLLFVGKFGFDVR